MAGRLDNLLGSLHSDKNKLTFLNCVYTPGNAEVADTILALSPNTSVLEKEVGYAREHGETQRFDSLARRFVDYYIQEGWDIALRDKVVGCRDNNIADYAVSKLDEKGE